MDKDEQIKTAIEEINITIEKEEQSHRERIKSYKYLISLIRKNCNHTKTKYVPDASGNNDSFHYCLICGEERKRFE
jgi:hypothetical protein